MCCTWLRSGTVPEISAYQVFILQLSSNLKSILNKADSKQVVCICLYLPHAHLNGYSAWTVTTIVTPWESTRKSLWCSPATQQLTRHNINQSWNIQYLSKWFECNSRYSCYFLVKLWLHSALSNFCLSFLLFFLLHNAWHFNYFWIPKRKNMQTTKKLFKRQKNKWRTIQKRRKFEFSYLTFFCLRLVSRRALVMSILRVVRMVNGTAVIINP